MKGVPTFSASLKPCPSLRVFPQANRWLERVTQHFFQARNIHGRSVQQGWNASGLVLLVTQLLPAAVTLLLEKASPRDSTEHR
jgi:hypothetical protein